MKYNLAQVPVTGNRRM